MSTFGPCVPHQWCIECRGWHGPGRHFPEWEVWEKDLDRDAARTVRANDAEGAVLAWAENLAGEDIEPVMSGVDLVARDSGGNETVMFLEGEPTVHWTAAVKP
jgi:hypothetical protein